MVLRIFIISILIIAFDLSAHAQVGISYVPEITNAFQLNDNTHHNGIEKSSASIMHLPNIKSIMTTPSIPKIYAFDNMAFFCKMEVRVEHKTKFPVKIRLGDIDYVNWQEGKGFRRYQGY